MYIWSEMSPKSSVQRPYIFYLDRFLLSLWLDRFRDDERDDEDDDRPPRLLERLELRDLAFEFEREEDDDLLLLSSGLIFYAIFS